METENLFNANNKDFQCSICQKYFSRKFTLDMHLLIHKGIKPHSCPFCGKCFRQRGTLMRHKALHSANNLFFCNLCNRGFRQKNVFLHHLKHRHNVSTETLDRRRHRTQLKDYESIMDTLPSFVLANSTAISTSEKDLDTMLLEAMNGIACKSSITSYETNPGLNNHNNGNEFDPPRIQNLNCLIDKSDESVQELRYECELCCVQFLDFTSYKLHVEEEHNNDPSLLDQKPFLFSLMSGNESVFPSNVRTPAEKENMPLCENLSFGYQDHSINLTSVEKSSKIKAEDSILRCTVCHESFMSDEDFGRHLELHMPKILIKNVNMQENSIAISNQATTSSNLGDMNSASCDIISHSKSFPDKAKLVVPSKNLISESTLKKPSTPDSTLIPNKDSKTTNELFRNNIKQFNCLVCKCYCSSNDSLKKHEEKHRFQNMSRFKNNHLKKDTSRDASLIEKCKHLTKSKLSFPSEFKVDISLNYSKFHSCPICTKTFKKIESLEYHRQMHLSARSFCCSHCKQRFSDKQKLLLHTRSSHLKTFKCNSCSRIFSYRKIYDFHVKKCLKSEVLEEFKANMDFPLVDIKELLKTNIEGLVGVIPLSKKKNSAENFKIGIPIFAVQHAKNVAQLPLLSFS